MRDNLSDFALFCAKTLARLRKGKVEYGDASFQSTGLELIEEIQQEVLDINGWSYLLYQRLEKVKKSLSAKRVDSWLDIDAGD